MVTEHSKTMSNKFYDSGILILTSSDLNAAHIAVSKRYPETQKLYKHLTVHSCHKRLFFKLSLRQTTWPLLLRNCAGTAASASSITQRDGETITQQSVSQRKPRLFKK